MRANLMWREWPNPGKRVIPALHKIPTLAFEPRQKRCDHVKAPSPCQDEYYTTKEMRITAARRERYYTSRPPTGGPFVHDVRLAPHFMTTERNSDIDSFRRCVRSGDNIGS